MAENDALREFGFYIEGVLLVSNEGVSFPNSVVCLRGTGTKFIITKFINHNVPTYKVPNHEAPIVKIF
jgi:hypothetical protein